MFTTDEKTRIYLHGMGVPVEYREDIAYDELKDDWNVVNHGRPKGQAKVGTAIDSYAELMEAGSPAPAVILHVTTDGYDVLDGIQRLNANLKTKSTTFCAYCVECSKRTASKLRIASNIALAGEAPVDTEWAVRELVVAFMIEGSDSAKDIASLCRRQVSYVEKIHNRERTRLRVDSLWEDGNAPVLKLAEYDWLAEHSEASDFDQAPGVVKEFVSTLHKCRFNNSDSRRYIAEFFGIKRIGNKKRTTQLQSKLRDFKRDPIVEGRSTGSRKNDAIENINRHIMTLFNAVKRHDRDGGELNDIGIAREWNEKMHEICRYLRKQCTTEVRRDINPFTI